MLSAKLARETLAKGTVTTESITDRLIAQADDELKKRISEAAKSLDTLLRTGYTYNIRVLAEGQANEVEVQWFVLLEALRKKAFEINKDSARKEAIDEFMAKVERLGHEIDDIRNHLVL